MPRGGSTAKAFPPETLAAWDKLLTEGWSYKDIAERYKTTDYHVRARFPNRSNKYKPTAEDIRKFEACLDDGWPYWEISRTFGVAPGVIYNRFPKRGMSFKEGSSLSLLERRTYAKLETMYSHVFRKGEQLA